jgi:hypothetical protein
MNRGFGGSEQSRGPEAGRMSGHTGAGTSGHQGEGGVAGAIKEKAQDVASSVSSTASEAWESAKRGVQDAASSVSEYSGDAWDSVNTFMTRYPFATFLCGFGLGMLVAQAFGSSSSWDFRRSSGFYPSSNYTGNPG